MTTTSSSQAASVLDRTRVANQPAALWAAGVLTEANRAAVSIPWIARPVAVVTEAHPTAASQPTDMKGGR